MRKRDVLIEHYASDLKEKCNIDPNMDLLKNITIASIPAIFNPDAATVSSSQQSELTTVKNSFLIKKLSLNDSPELDKAIDSVIEVYGRSNKNKYRVVIYYLLTVHFKKENVFKD
jgi:hypothetical protein